MKKRRQRTKHSKSTKLKGFFIRMKLNIKSVMSTIARFMPVALVLAAIGLTMSDQGTDVATAHRICTAHCGCEPYWKTCIPAGGSCSSAIINGASASNHCELIIKYADPEDCQAKNPWPILESYHALVEKVQCSCNYLPSVADCILSNQNCSSVIINGTLASDYCKIENWQDRHDKCNAKDTWKVSATQLQFRHPYWCLISSGFILGPSILNNLFLLYNLLHNSNYKKYFFSAGLSCLADIQYAYIAIILLSVLQVLPYFILVLKMVIVLRICMKYIDEDHDSNDLNILTTRMMVIFSFTEDLPQLTFQMMIFLRAIDGYGYGITDDISWIAMSALLTSCISLSKNYTEFIKGPQSSVGSKIFTFFTAFIAVGGRILTSCLFEDFISWHTMLPICLIIAIHIISSFFKCILCKLFFSSQNKKEDMTPFQENKYQRLFSVVYKTGKVIRSILFGAIIDGQSVSGLWASSMFVWVAMWIKIYWIPDQAVFIALAITTFSYIINALSVLLYGQYKRQGLLMALLFVLFPIGIFIYGFYEYEFNHKLLHERLISVYLEIVPEIFIFTMTIGFFVILSFVISLVLDTMKIVSTETEIAA